MGAQTPDTSDASTGSRPEPSSWTASDEPVNDPADEPQESRPDGTIVVKIGGSTLGSHDTTLEDLVGLQKQGASPVVIHGGGKVITEWMEKQGARPRFVRGLRVTDAASLEIVVAVLCGVVNKSIVASIQSMGGRAIGMSGIDGAILRAEVDDPELGLVGKVKSVNAEPISAAVEKGFIPVVAPVALRADGERATADSFLNVNADTAAGEIAAALEVQRLVVMTDVEGVLDTSRRLIPRLTQRQARDLMHSNIIAGGMVPKIGACLKALEVVGETYIIDGRKAHTLKETLAGGALGTRVG